MTTSRPRRSHAVCAGLLLLAAGGQLANAKDINHIGVNQKVLVICVKYTDAATTRLATATDWVNLLSGETNTFYNRATYNLTNFSFLTTAGGPADGWHSLGYDSTGYDFYKTGQDAISLADPFVDFSDIDRVLVITNWPNFGGQGGGPWDWEVEDGVEHYALVGGVSVGKRAMTMSIVNEWQASSFGMPFDEAASVAAHELGHQLGVPTHYAAVSWFPGLPRDVITPWDIMGLSPSLNHFLGWAKVNRGWIPDVVPRVQDIGPPVGSSIDTTIPLQPLELYTTATQIIRVPFTSLSPGDKFSGYLIENRRQINGDENLPSEGVLISLIDEGPTIILKCIVLDDDDSPGDMNQAVREVADTFVDATRGITISVVGQSGNAYDVRVQYKLPPTARPDPMIIPWGAPPWETVDIWVDSQKNGWDVYKYTDAAGQPVGNGDDAWVNHENRLYARIRNVGPGPAVNVRVQIYSNSPPGMGDSGAGWEYRGTLVAGHIASGGDAVDYVRWTPKVGAHTCVKAVIEDTAEELSTTNNIAQENVTAFDTSAGSPYEPVGLKITVNNPSERERTPVHFNVRDVPRGWMVMVDPPKMLLPPAGSGSVYFEVSPSGPQDRPATDELRQYGRKYQPGFVGKPKIEALVPYADTFIPIGGVELWAHLTNATELTIDVRSKTSGGPQNVPDGRDKENRLGLRADPRADVPKKLVDHFFVRNALVRGAQAEVSSVVGEPVVVSGQLTPAVADATIAIEFSLDGRQEIQLEKTDQTGRYITRFVPSTPGHWTAQAFFAGNRTLAAADSAVRPFLVTKQVAASATEPERTEGPTPP